MTNASSRTWADGVVDGHVGIAFRDYGGDGPDVLLLPGAGRTVADWGPVASRLRGYRLVAIDLRNHGLSGDGEWNIADVLTDVQAVIDALSLNQPAVVGHSLGGMIAGLWAGEHPECPAAINLDGHGQGRPEHYDGLAPEVVRERLATLTDLSKQAAVLAFPIEQADVLIAGQVEQAKAAGLDIDVVEEGIRRSLVTIDGMVRPRPIPPFLDQLLASIDSLDLMTVWSSTRCPLLVVNADAPMDLSALGPSAPTWLGEFMATYRAGLTRTLTALAERHPLVTLELFTGDHGLLLNQPDATAAVIRQFLDEHVR